MVKIVIVDGQILTEVFIRKRMNEQFNYLNELGGNGWVKNERNMEKWESGRDRYNYFEELLKKLKTIYE